MKGQINCQLCGQCCHHIIETPLGPKLSDNKCKFLVKLPSGRAICRSFKDRIGKKIAEGQICILRSMSKYDYVGCPYNSGKPIITREGVLYGDK